MKQLLYLWLEIEKSMSLIWNTCVLSAPKSIKLYSGYNHVKYVEYKIFE